MSEDFFEKIRQQVRRQYGTIAESGGCGCAPSPQGPCCGSAPSDPNDLARLMGYAPEDLGTEAQGANLGLGCGNPTAIGELRPGETVLDLGSGAGFDCFLAARRVAPGGRVIGVDMTPAMLAKARENARRMEIENVEFRLGEIEHLPAADESVDVVLSNCVVNLSPEKDKVFREVFRVLKPGGRLALSDVVATGELPAGLREQPAFLTGCIAGAERIDRLERILAEAGFVDVRIRVKPYSRELIGSWFPGSGAEAHVASADIEAVKPGAPEG